MLYRTIEAKVENDGKIAVIELSGEISSSADESLQQAYRAAQHWHPKAILLDFNNVDYINSTGIALIVRLFGDALQANQLIAVAGLNEHYTDIFKITRLTDYSRLYMDRSTAIHELGKLI